MNPLTVTRPPKKIEDRQGIQAGGLRRFRPRLALGFQQELHLLAEQVSGLPYEEAQVEIERTLETADARHMELASLGLSADELTPTLQWTTALRVLRDLHTQGWRLSSDDEGLLMDSPGVGPSGQDPEVQKLAIRRSFSFARDAQLAEPSIARFIKGMERKGIDRLFADGAEVAGRATKGGVNAIQPELELVETGARDAGTGLLLQDIWRYARHFWSIPYQSTPGRNMFYLVRDGALPERPLIGIAALGNPVLGLAQRDDYAGWSLRGLQAQLAKMDSRKQRAVQKRLVEVLDQGIGEIYAKDLFRGRRPKDWRSVVSRLREIEQDSADQRLEELGREREGRDDEYLTIRAAHSAASKGHGESVDWTSIAKTNLYRRKRAGALADLIRAKGAFEEAGAPASGWLQRAMMTEDGVRAVEIALRRIKQSVIASSVMELITCGAVPPYRDVLGGKLVAVMMLSRTVVDDYQRKYSDHVSLIASALAGKPVKRPTRLALITTSSLYAVGSSQYNRLKIPAGDGGSVAYRRIGMTESFGTVHFAQDTVLALSQVARFADSNRRRVNNLFGEGTSPKLRLVRSGIECLGLQPDVFLRHHSPRLLYGAELCSNASDVFLGLTNRPKYVLPEGEASTELVVEYWRERWLRNRLDRDDVRERLEAERRQDFLLGNEPVLMALGTADSRGTTIEPTAETATSAPQQGTKETFVERLYRSSNSYADRLTQDELDAIHVDLGVDGFLLDEANEGKQIIVTGNPGDGKTHLIERLRPQLEAAGAEVITDANACSDEETLDTWEQCQKKKKAFVLAINEWPLFVLQRLAKERGFTPVAEALRQVKEARFFVDSQQPDDPAENVVTIDLSLRNLLAPNVVQQVIDRLTDEQFYEGLNEADPMLKNREALRTPQVAERLTQLLKVVSVRLDHVTMRQLVGFIAYLLSAGQSAADRLKAGQDANGLTYSSLAFEGGEGQLFDMVRDVFDPAAMTHPIWDERLWRGDLDSNDWLYGAPPSVLALPEVERKVGFRATKRRFFFEHAQGSSLLGLTPKDEVEFEETLEEGAAGTTSMVRDLVLALNRFYEPDFPERDQDRLLLWQSHRYDVRAPAAFVSLRELPHQRLRIEALRYAEWIESWLPPEQQDRRSFALVATGSDSADCALLEIDRELYLTLLEAQRGLGRSSWSRTATRRITRFVDRIDRALETKTGVEDLRIRNVDTDLDEKFAVQRKPARYQV